MSSALQAILLLLLLLFSQLVADEAVLDGDGDACSRANSKSWTVLEKSLAVNLSQRCAAEWTKIGDKGTMLERSLVYERRQQTPTQLNRLNRLRLERLFARMSREPERPVNVLVFGGSMTAGRFVKGFAGAWPATLEWEWGRKVAAERTAHNRSLALLHVTNAAVAGTSSQWLLERLSHYFPRSAQVDLVLLDYDINDMAAWADSDEERAAMQAVVELVVRRVLLARQSPAVVWVNVATSHRSGGSVVPQCIEYRSMWQHYQAKLPVMDAYGVAVVSQQAAVWSNWSCPPHRGFWDCMGVGCAHPGWNGHQVLADIMTNFIGVHVLTSASASALVSGAGSNSSVVAAADPHSPRTASSASLSSPSPPNANSSSSGGSSSSDDERERAELRRQPFVANASTALDECVCWRTTTWLDRDNTEAVLEAFRRSRSNSSSAASASAAPAAAATTANASPAGAGAGATDVDSASGAFETPPVLVSADACWIWKQDLQGKEKGFIAEGCYWPNASALVFAVRFGRTGVLVVNHLTTWNHTAGMADVAVSPPPTSIPTELPAASAFKSLGVIDGLSTFGDGGGHSIISPTVFSGSPLIVRNALHLVRIALVDANVAPWHEKRDRFERRTPRLSPQRIKITGLSSC